MNNRLFNLPNNILSEIYEMDDTYRDIFKKQCLYAIWKGSFAHFKYNLLSNDFFNNKPILRDKIKTILEYLFEDDSVCWFKYHWYDRPTDEKPMPNDIHIICYWNGYTFTYNYHTLDKIDSTFPDDSREEEQDSVYFDIGLRYISTFPFKYHKFKGYVFTNKLYQEYISNNRYNPKQHNLYKYNDERFTVIQYTGDFTPSSVFNRETIH